NGGKGGNGSAGGQGGMACVPIAEICDNLDNDCDGKIDNGLMCLCLVGETQSCYDGDPSTIGVAGCLAGTQTCGPTGAFGTCDGQVLPGLEMCNGLDDDCNGNVDEGFGTVTCGVGACKVTVDACTNGMTNPCVPLPPSPMEACDGTDDNCDGRVDEGCSCIDGQTQSCYTGPNGTEGTGACAAGTQTCMGGMWGMCAGDVTPQNETCNGIDDDCNGQVDEGLGVTVCGTGACHVSVNNCANGNPQMCVPGNPGTETCNGIDDDCDIDVDEDLGTTSCGVGACLATVPACTSGQPTPCVPGMPSPEACDGIDNDCNGAVDNGNPGGGGPCMTGNMGVCAAGTNQCVGGQIVCAQTTTSSPEVCDNLDNDCNGTVDDNPAQVGTPCMTTLPGVCTAGTRACTNGMLVCVSNTMASPEVCDNLDNDCDGQLDDGNPGGGMNCNTGNLGICAAGSTNCVNGQIVCNQNTAPNVELCDNLDNDCNGVVDDNAQQVGTPCTTGQPGVCSAGTRACMNGMLVCNRNVNPSGETCDNLDNDCDGMVDDDPATVGDPCNTGLQGVCAAGTKVCSNGMISCSQTTQASPEVCDGLDNDCNGAVDNGSPGAGMNCSTGQLGVCDAGTTACTGGAVVCNRNINPSSESCDNLDNDCDGMVDDNPATVGDPCTTGLPGVCSAGTKVCTNGAISCSQTTQSSAEVCDGLDNDCNGVVDNDNPGGGVSCSTGQQGVCSAGTTSCANGAIACNRNVDPSAEMCDGLDNDCNGVVDNGNPGGGVSCSTGQQGVCSAGTTSCTNGSIACNRNVNPSAETCDGFDNDCNGTVDNGNPGGNVACMTGQQGVCSAGTTSCTNGSIACNRNVNPSTETCDGLDNDCNGVADNGNPGGGASCNTTELGVCRPGTTSCLMGAIVCNRNQGPSTEICDGLDNDCNGTVDNGNPGGNMSCMTGQLGVCSAGTTSCSGGAIVCNRNQGPTTETCNSVDDNCDGTTDNGPAEACDGVDNDCNGQVDENPNSLCSMANPGAGGVSTWGCNGTCSITACQPGYANIDNMVNTGCECTTDTYANSCAAASTVNVAVGATVNLTGKIETANGSDWVRVVFADRVTGQPYHPQISLSTNPGGQYAMDVQSACGTPAACSPAGNGMNTESGTNVTVWEQYNSNYVPGAGCCSDNTPHATNMFVRVYRKNADAPRCEAYIVTATNL
ncbi:MAG TPA: MopE-related protein, partial [Polyangium sp.]|nr:MopE-related protein [Polyangium sp.]